MPEKGNRAKKEKGASKTPLLAITERKPMEEEMKKLSSAIEQSIDGIAIGDLEPKLTYVNHAFARMHGYSREEMIGMKLVNLYNGEQMDEYKRGMNQIKTQGSWEGKIGHIRKDGTHFATYMSVTLLKGNDGKPRGIVAVATDITEDKQAEEVLKDSETKFKTIVENIRDVVFQLSPLGIIQYVSPKVQEVYGYKPEDLIGKHLKKTTPVSELPKALKVLMSVLSGKVISNFEINQRDANGKIIPMEINATPVRKAGKIIAVQGIMRDITKRKRAEEALRKAHDELEMRVKERTAELTKANEELRIEITERKWAEEELREMREELIRSERLAAIGQLAGGVGHELRNPLGAIKNAVYYVKGKVSKSELVQKEPRVMEFLDIMDDEINTSNKIINDLLGFSRVGKPSVSPTQIEKVIEDALSRTSIPENIELSKKLDTELPQIEIDASQIHQVLVNMISNAVQAMPEGGKLTIAAREKESFLEVEIADTGCGIPEEAVDKIFDPLFTTRAKGIGLGLAVCKAIIDRHEGNIEVKSRVGKGTTFIIKLPLKTE